MQIKANAMFNNIFPQQCFLSIVLALITEIIYSSQSRLRALIKCIKSVSLHSLLIKVSI